MFISDAMESFSAPSSAPSTNDQDYASPDNGESLANTPGSSPRNSAATAAQRGFSFSRRLSQSPLAPVHAKDDGTAAGGIGAGYPTGRRLSGPEDLGLSSITTRASSTLLDANVGDSDSSRYTANTGATSSEQQSGTHVFAANDNSRNSGGSFPGNGLERGDESGGGGTSANEAGFRGRDEKQSSLPHRPIAPPRPIDTGAALRSPENVSRSPAAFVRLVK